MSSSLSSSLSSSSSSSSSSHLASCLWWCKEAKHSIMDCDCPIPKGSELAEDATDVDILESKWAEFAPTIQSGVQFEDVEEDDIGVGVVVWRILCCTSREKTHEEENIQNQIC
eukprot:TRINITY_DN13036_c0_g2_i1.p1 TRINITY_DN13036_c0_g2~~TRINITY_DN13036_c0_g2_i1.p1  ORF type:complete len:113 (-),score=15.13 TRINITY_DN13036_c0_g2_i1:80-418(-)